MRGSLFALGAALALVVAVAAPGIAAASSAGNDEVAGNAPLSVAVSHSEEVTVSVTENGTGVANASVLVTTVGENTTYAGVGNYTTDANGTVGLASPVENVTIEVTAIHEGRTASTTATLSAEDRPFGQAVAGFVSILQSESDGPIGQTLAAWVVANNPGNAPEHAGPPAHAGPDGDNRTDAGSSEHAGGPDDAGLPGNGERGPPAHTDAGAGDNVDANETDTDANATVIDSDDSSDGESDESDGGGPPPDAGPPAHANDR